MTTNQRLTHRNVFTFSEDSVLPTAEHFFILHFSFASVPYQYDVFNVLRFLGSISLNIFYLLSTFNPLTVTVTPFWAIVKVKLLMVCVLWDMGFNDACVLASDPIDGCIK